MLQFENKTPFEKSFALLPDADGVESLLTILKGTFSLGPHPALLEEQLPVCLEDVYDGEPGQGGLLSASEFGFPKPGTDVVLSGTAYAPRGTPTPEMDVTLQVGSINKKVRVFGDRRWEKSLFKPSISKPETFVSMPLTWDRAFGGVHAPPDADGELQAESRNPVGCGFFVEGEQAAGARLPNLECPDELITAWEDRPPPAAFAPICPHWEPRRSYAGTYDEEWQKKRAPYLPTDFDERFFQVAAPDQIVEGHLQGGERVVLSGVSPDGIIEIMLPRWSVVFDYVIQGQAETLAAQLDTVTFFPDESRLHLIWRSMFRCDKKGLEVSKIVAIAKNDSN